MPRAFPIVHLLVCQYCSAFRTPIYSSFLPINQPLFQKFKEKILIPFVIFWFAGFYYPAPVIAQSKFFLLPYEVCNCLISKFLRVRFCLYSSILGRKAKSIISHWVENIKALHPLKAGINITNCIIKSMAHMQPASRRIRKHLQNIILFLSAIFFYLECLFLFPLPLPLFFYCLKINLFISLFHSYFSPLDFINLFNCPAFYDLFQL